MMIPCCGSNNFSAILCIHSNTELDLNMEIVCVHLELESFVILFVKGVLRIHVIGAEDLVAKDTNVFSKDTSDPYAIITGM